jgi:hypothetical protein
LYYQAIKQGWPLPSTFEAWSFFSYDCQPLPTKHLSAADVLRFRDRAWESYFKRPEYLNLIQSRFGAPARDYLEELTKVKIRRKLLGD